MIKSLALRFFSVFSKPAHIEQLEIIPIEQQYKSWSIKLHSPTLTQRINEAKPHQEAAIKAASEHLDRNNAFIDAFLNIPKDEPIIEIRDRLPAGWRIKT